MIRTLKALMGAMLVAGALAMPPAAQAQVNRELWFNNNCRHPIRFFIYHEHADGNWVTHGWYQFEGNEANIRPSQNGRPLIHIEGRPLYMYAETTNGTRIFWEGQQLATFNGQEYALMRATISVRQGNMSFGVNCNNQ